MTNNTVIDAKAEVIHDVISFIKKEVVNDTSIEINGDDHLISKGLIDSMGIIRLMTHLQNLYGIKDFDQSDLTLDNFRTPERIAEMIAKYR